MNLPVLSLIVCSCMMIFVLCDAGEKDIKTTYLHKRCMLAAYFVAGIYLISLVCMGEFDTLKSSLLSFLGAAGIYFLILLVENLRRRNIRKRKEKHPELAKNEYVPKEETAENDLPIGKKNSPLRTFMTVVFSVLVAGFFAFSSFYNTVENSAPLALVVAGFVIFEIIAFTGTVEILRKKGLERKYSPVLAMGLIFGFYIFCFLLRYRNIYSIGAFLSLSIGILFILLFYILVFSKIKDAELSNVDKDGFLSEEEMNEDNGENMEEFLILGGGDALLLGALAILFSGAGVISILMYSAIAGLCITVGRKIYNGTPISGTVPFIPAIAIGTVLYTCGFSPLNYFI